MSRTVARMIDRLIDFTVLPLNRRQRDKTMARVLLGLGRRGLRSVRTDKGFLHFYALRGAGTASAVERFKQDEPETLQWIDQWIKPGDTLWDIGANIGLYSLYAGLTPGVSVYAFEPSGLNFGLLVEHIERNNMGHNVKPLCVALSNVTKIENLHVSEFATGHASNSVGRAESQFKSFDAVFSQAVPVFTADDFCKIFHLAPPDHIKLDVDGIEDSILEGAAKILHKVKTIVIEVEGRNAENVEAGIEAPLRRAGFEEDLSYRSQGSCRNRLYVNRGNV